jgi:hypothetical protein
MEKAGWLRLTSVAGETDTGEIYTLRTILGGGWLRVFRSSIANI